MPVALSAKKLLALVALLACALLAFGASQASGAGRLKTASFGTDGTSATSFTGPEDLAFDQAASRLYVMETGSAKVHAFTTPALTPTGGAFPLSLAGDGFGGIAVDNSASPSEGHIFYTSESADEIYGFDSAGAALGGNFPVSPAPPTNPCGVAVDPSGNVWVPDQSTGVVSKYDSTGSALGSVNVGPIGFGECALAFDSNGDMFVARNNRQVWRYPAPSYTSPTLVAPRSDQPDTIAIAVDRSSHQLYVVHHYHSAYTNLTDFVSVYKPDGTLLYSFGGGTVGTEYRGVAVNQATGTVYVSDRSHGKVYAYAPLTASVGTPSSVSDTGAVLHGIVNTGAALTGCHFEYVSGASFGDTGFTDLSSGGSVPCEQAPGSIPPDRDNHAVSADASFPTPREAYVYRLVVESGAGSVASEYRAAHFGPIGFDGSVLQENGDPAIQAGSHPFTASTIFAVPPNIDPIGREWPSEDLKDAIVKLPAGLVGNVRSIPQCSAAQLEGNGFFALCPEESQVGFIRLCQVGFTGTPGNGECGPVPVYNLKPPFGTPAIFGFNFAGAVVHIAASLRTGQDYGVNVTTLNSPESLPLSVFKFTFWGVPADPGHDFQRGFCVYSETEPCPSSAPLKAFLSLPTSCTGPGPNNSVETRLTLISWLGSEGDGSFLSHDNAAPTPNPIGGEGCENVDFSPTIEARPTTNIADSPSGLDVDLHIPQNDDPEGTAEAHLKDTVVTLPPGLVVNPASANGLDGCSPAEFGLTSALGATPIHTTAAPGNCPDASKVGTVEVDTPLLDHPLVGGVFIADPHDNPFETLLALYITVDDPESGIVVKLAGKVEPDPVTGRLTTTFPENPQQPFEDFKLHFFAGSGGALRTPAVCGSYQTESSLTPWTAPDGATATPSDSWTISQGPEGGPCAASEADRPNAPALDAGTVAPIARAYSPLVVNLRREDGSQNFSEVTVTPPPGLVGKLAGIPYCPDSALQAAAAKSGAGETSSPSCPAASQVGTVSVAAGAGPAPYWADGKAYLTGPYKGAPIGLAIVTPATAGPFDLGTVVVKSALFVDPKTAQITAKSDPLPAILQGIPLDIRQALIRLDRPEFTLNPTNCDPMTFTGTLTSTLGQAAPVSNRFQLGECSGLGLKPAMTLSLNGGTKRRGHPALTAVLEPRPTDANFESISVALPPSELLDQAHIGTVCTRVQFAADECPADSVYGTAEVITPLLDFPLSGNVYLRSNPEHDLPDLVPDFRGPASQPIRLEAAGQTDTTKGGALRNTFEGIPDAPFTRLTLTLAGGSKGLIQNSKNLCAKKYRATIRYIGQNGTATEQNPVVKAKCPKKHRKPHRHSARRSSRHAGR